MIVQWSVDYPMHTRTEKRKVYIYLPTDYDDSGKVRYPVLYGFDGHNLFDDDEATFGKSWGLANYLDFTDTPLIVVGIECNHHGRCGRLKEYAPFNFRELEGDGRNYRGYGHETMEWIVNELKPMIDSEFATLEDRDHTFVIGSSFGGIMALYSVLEYNHIFSRAASLSPSLWAGRSKFIRLAKETPLDPNTVIYMDFGAEEFYGPNTPENFYTMAGILAEREVMLTTRIIPGGTHCEESWEHQMPFAIPSLMYGIEPYVEEEFFEDEYESEEDLYPNCDDFPEEPGIDEE